MFSLSKKAAAVAAATVLATTATMLPSASAGVDISSYAFGLSVKHSQAKNNVNVGEWQRFTVRIANNLTKDVNNIALNDKLTSFGKGTVDYKVTCDGAACPEWADGVVKKADLSTATYLLGGENNAARQDSRFSVPAKTFFTLTVHVKVNSDTCGENFYVGNNVSWSKTNGRTSPDSSIGSTVFGKECATKATPAPAPEESTPAKDDSATDNDYNYDYFNNWFSPAFFSWWF